MPRTSSSDIDSKAAGLAIREGRQARGLTQAQLAARLNVSDAYIQKLEGGRANPTVGQLANVGRALSMDLQVGFVPMPEVADPFAEFAEV